MINLGIYRRGDSVAMTQKLPNLRQRCTAAQHKSCRRVAQPMRVNPSEAAPLCCASNDHAHRHIGKSAVWRRGSCEYRSAMRVYRTAVLKVCCHRFSDIRRQWHSLCTIAFGVRNHDLASSPIYVVKFELGDFT
jgi:hypothetical protein